MARFAVSLLLASIFAGVLAEPQRDVTFTVTCLGPRCTDYPPTTNIIPTSIPNGPGGGPSTMRTSATPPPQSTRRTSAPQQPSSTRRTSATPPPQQPSTTRRTSATPPRSSSRYTPPPDTPTKTTKKPPTQTGGEEVGPSSTRCPVPLYYQCDGYYDGKPWTGCTKCVSGAKCIWQNDYYYQCVADE